MTATPDPGLDADPSATPNLSGTPDPEMAGRQEPGQVKKPKLKKRHIPDGRVAILLSRGDVRGLLEWVGAGVPLRRGTAKRVRAGLLTRAERSHAQRNHASAAVVFIDEATHVAMVAALDEPGAVPDQDLVVVVIRDAMDALRERLLRRRSGSLPAAGAAKPRRIDPHKAPTVGRMARIVPGGAPGSKRSH